MMTRTTLVLVGALAALATGCGSEVTGGGGGAGGGSGGAGDGTGGATTTSTTSTSTADGGGGDTTTATTAGPGGGGGGNSLGTCEAQSGTSGTSGAGITECVSDYVCDGGAPSVECTDDGTTEICDCSMNGNFVGSCVDEDQSGCSFPQNCCFSLLGGHAEPNPGPYGACDNTSGQGSTSSGGGNQECGSYYDCDAGSIEIECSQSNGGDANCECFDGNRFLLGTCTQPALECGYEGGCCYDIFN